MVSDELIRIAILWHEQWHAGLEKASNYHFTDKDFNSMFAVLEPLHKLINSGTDFNQPGSGTAKKQIFRTFSSHLLVKLTKFCTSEKLSNLFFSAPSS